MMKKTVIILAFLLILVGCGGGDKEAVTEAPVASSEPAITEVVTEVVTEASPEIIDEVPVRIDELLLRITCKYIEALDSVTSGATFMNKSPYAITNLKFKVSKKDTGEIESLSSSETIMPNEESYLFLIDGPESGLESDLKITEIEYSVTRDDENYTISYDAKTEKYKVIKWTEEDLFITQEPLVKIEELPYEISLKEADLAEEVNGVATYTNNSRFKTCNYDLEVRVKTDISDYYEKLNYSNTVNVLPGETSPKLQVADTYYGLDAGAEIEPRKLQLTVVDENNQRFYIEYDYKLERYRMAEKKTMLK